MVRRDKEKILIVEDDPISLRSLITLFKNDYDITVATTGTDCLSHASAEHQLFLLDLHLPDIHGFDLLKQFKDNEKLADIPIIFITANRDITTEENGIRLGAVDFITKPFSPAVLRARVQLHLELRRKTKMLETLAKEDGLTGIANRRQFDILYAGEWRRSLRDHLPVSVIMGDIDRFKVVNDTYGHPVGDQTLRLVAATLSEQIYRTTDILARYGGEEFVVVLHNTALEGAVQVAERLRLAVQDAFKEPPQGVPAGVSISLGCASIVPTSAAFGALIDSADKCLVRAKENGRNRVES